MSDTIDIKVPAEQEGTKAIVRSWLVKVGDRVELDGPLVELETDKVTQEVPSPAAGVLTEILLDTDDEAEPGAILGRMTLGAAREENANGPDNGHAPVPVTGLSPAVRRAIKEHGIDPATITGTGRGGRITRADVDKAVAERATAPASAPAPSAPASTSAGGVTTIPHDRMRLAIAQNMLHSVTVAPHVTAVFECDFSAVMAHRDRHKAAFEKDGAKLTFTAYILAACAEAMKAAPAVNSRWSDDRLEIFDDVNIGVGTALGDKGLIVPVVRRVQDLSLQGIAKRLSELTARAREGKLSGGDVAGGTFTVSNHGVSGSLVAAPIIINQPQSAILGVGKLEKRVVAREAGGSDTIQIRPMCYVSLTIDHRAIDGHQTNAWLTRFVETIENWGEA
ncbi:dihydrolipoamide succinyltransferase [Altererythrobacter soli]|uniref:Dihydrolipoamide acetyltransferase component of pyruvate dehydrogenase complex n=1 Tax=Croceibacterium soli TaxID=1739690 RepID=A0A6I4UXS9_9SPHN|nr:2-oxo acid dehydrogenase subunit E2 [Croceibacterium soli]MXP42599.1 dihydrolipoamide succinyltransferase [Croceibacterium soli]